MNRKKGKDCMNYFKVELCKKLQEKGLVSESGVYYYQSGYSLEFHPMSEIEAKHAFIPHDEDWEYSKNVSAFIFQDLLTKDNAVKLWGETVVCPNCGFMWSAPTHCCWYQEAQYVFDTDGKMFIENWNYQSKNLLDLYQQSGLEAVESYLKDNL